MIPVITVDGPSGAGKGTVCQLLAQQYGFHLLDSGALYRVTAVACLKQGIDLRNAEVVAEIASQLPVGFKPGEQGVCVFLDEEDVSRDIRTEHISMQASIVAAHIPVREALLERQRHFRQAPGLVADGRDMGTTVFPNADVKIFLTASAEERARRRYQQLLGRGESANLRALVEDIQRRDQRDMQRSVSPLKPAPDAMTIDSTSMPIDEVLEAISSIIKQRLDIA